MNAPAPATPTRDPRAYTPRHLADRILTSRSALEGERKQVTVLFADVKGSLELTERVDPEQWHGILDRFFRILADGVHRFEGTLNQFTGDGVMALFGAPIAHEDHAQRACWAALYLKRELRRFGDDLRMRDGLNFSVRMGLNSGEVVVGSIGDDLRMDYTAQGQAVGLAARMEQLAEAGRIYLTDRTAALVHGYFTLEEIGELEVRGVSEPVRTYELRDVGPLRSRLDVSRARGFSRFVGRVQEMQILAAALDEAIAGNGQVVGVVADAGIGKSRLCWEFSERARARGIDVRSAHGVAHGRMIPFLPVLDLLRGLLEVDERDAAQTARNKIAGFLLLLARDFEESLPLLFDFLGVPDPESPAPPLTGDARQRQLFAVIGRLLRALAERRPGVLILEDLHWIDSGSAAFVASAIEAIEGTRTLLIVNFRPEYEADWMQSPGYRQIPLRPLGDAETRELLLDLLGDHASLADTAERIVERTAGNPFFIEEVVLSLAETGTLAGARGAYRLVRAPSELAIPPTVQAVLAARIDRLGEPAKRVLQTAAVIGRSVGEGLLSRVSERPEAELQEALRRLVATGFLYEESLYPETEYRFKHALTREVALGSLLAPQRRPLHRAVAEAIEERDAERLDERAALLAHHWEGAGDSWRAACCHRQAAEWSGAGHAQEGFGHWLKVRELLGGLDPSPEVDELGAMAVAQILSFGGRVGAPEAQMSELFGEGEELARRSSSDHAMARIASGYGIYRFYTTGERGEADALLAEGVRLADRTDDVGLQTVCRFYHQLELVEEDLARALEVNAEGIALCGGDAGVGAEVLGYSPRMGLLAVRAPALCRVGRASEGRALVEEVRTFSREHDDPPLEALADQAAAEVAWSLGDAQGSVAGGLRAVDLSERTENDALRVLCYHRLGHALLLAERWDEAAAALTHSLELMRERRTYRQWESFSLAGRACAELGQGFPEAALRDSAEAVERGARTGVFAEAEARLTSACVSLCAEGAPAAARVAGEIDRADALFVRAAARGREPWLAEARSALAGLVGDTEAEKHQLERAQRLHRERGAPGHADRARRQAEVRFHFQHGP